MKALLVLVWIVVIIGGILGTMFISQFGRAEGNHQGFVTAVERTSGIFFTVDSAYVKTSLETTQEDLYCVLDPEVKAQLDQAAKDKAPVTLSFQNDLIVWKWECASGTQSIIRSVQR